MQWAPKNATDQKELMFEHNFSELLSPSLRATHEILAQNFQCRLGVREDRPVIL